MLFEGIKSPAPIPLGSFKDAMISTECALHPLMFLSYFVVDSDKAYVINFTVSREGTGVYLNAKIPPNRYTQAGPFLSIQSSEIDMRHRGRLVDSH